jgi:transcriptional regulator with XRE-family HTH domain
VVDSEAEARIKRQFGARVRRLRKAMGLLQEGLALRCELDRSYVGGVERGERNVSLINIARIASALGVLPKDLLTPSDHQ